MIYTVTFNPAVDYVMHPLTLDMGFTNRSSSEEVRCGGNGINVSSILNELNVDTICLGIIAGFTGDYILDTLQSAGVTCNFVRLDKGFTRINVKLNGIVMTIINGMGPKIPNDKVDELFGRLDRIKAGDTLVLTGSIPKCLPDDMYQIIMTRLAGRGIRFVVDAPGSLLLQSLESEPFMIKPNNHELGKLFDVNPETPEECMPYARMLHERGAQNVVVSCGGEGSALVAADGNERHGRGRLHGRGLPREPRPWHVLPGRAQLRLCVRLCHRGQQGPRQARHHRQVLCLVAGCHGRVRGREGQGRQVRQEC